MQALRKIGSCVLPGLIGVLALIIAALLVRAIGDAKDNGVYVNARVISADWRVNEYGNTVYERQLQYTHNGQVHTVKGRSYTQEPEGSTVRIRVGGRPGIIILIAGLGAFVFGLIGCFGCCISACVTGEYWSCRYRPALWRACYREGIIDETCVREELVRCGKLVRRLACLIHFAFVGLGLLICCLRGLEFGGAYDLLVLVVSAVAILLMIWNSMSSKCKAPDSFLITSEECVESKELTLRWGKKACVWYLSDGRRWVFDPLIYVSQQGAKPGSSSCGLFYCAKIAEKGRRLRVFPAAEFRLAEPVGSDESASCPAETAVSPISDQPPLGQG